jgi:hypothetical protein
MKQSITELEINGTIYVPKSDQNILATPLEGLPYVMVRTLSAGVFMGYLKERNGKEGELLKARRIWYWEGAASLSQLATEGTSKPEKCKFPIEVEKVILTEIIEIDFITEKAKLNLNSVVIWKQ